MKYIPFIFLFCLLAMQSGCISFHAKGRLIDIDRVAKSDLQYINYVPENASVCGIANYGHIYAVNAKHLYDCLKQIPAAVLYTWSPNCHAKSCILIATCQDYCKKNNYELFVLADYYDMAVMKPQNNAIHPIMTANHLYYKTENGNKLGKQFMNELVSDAKGREMMRKNYFRFYFFEYGVLKQIAGDISDLNQSNLRTANTQNKKYR